jgi:hypothetical protein
MNSNAGTLRATTGTCVIPAGTACTSCITSTRDSISISAGSFTVALGAAVGIIEPQPGHCPIRIYNRDEAAAFW